MQVKTLKNMLEFMPDDAEVFLENYYAGFTRVNEARLYNIRTNSQQFVEAGNHNIESDDLGEIRDGQEIIKGFVLMYSEEID